MSEHTVNPPARAVKPTPTHFRGVTSCPNCGNPLLIGNLDHADKRAIGGGHIIGDRRCGSLFVVMPDGTARNMTRAEVFVFRALPISDVMRLRVAVAVERLAG
jgi:hypothetical protein